MKKIIFIIESIFNKRDYHRFGIDILKKKGYDVKVWDLSPLLRPEYFNNYSPPDPINFDKHILIHDKNYAVKLIEKLSNQHVVICFMGIDAKNAFVYDYLSKNNIIYGFALCGLLPSKRNSLLRKVKRVLQNPSWGLKKVIGRIKINKIEIEPADFLIVGGKEAINDGRYPIRNQTNIIKAHSFDYDRFIEDDKNNNNKIKEGNAYAVFLDQYLPYHPDVIGNVNEITAEDYYSPLNTFFSFLEEKLGLEIIIVAHPRSHYDKVGNPFDERKILINSNIHHVKHSKLVLAHCSTSINFAVLYNKPIIFISEERYHSYFIEAIETMASSFGKKPIELSNKFPHELERELLIKREFYDNYKEMYIKETGTPEKPVWEIFADYLNRLSF